MELLFNNAVAESEGWRVVISHRHLNDRDFVLREVYHISGNYSAEGGHYDAEATLQAELPSNQIKTTDGKVLHLANTTVNPNSTYDLYDVVTRCNANRKLTNVPDDLLIYAGDSLWALDTLQEHYVEMIRNNTRRIRRPYRLAVEFPGWEPVDFIY